MVRNYEVDLVDVSRHVLADTVLTALLDTVYKLARSARLRESAMARYKKVELAAWEGSKQQTSASKQAARNMIASENAEFNGHAARRVVSEFERD
eukprot:IDg20941t1